jgi:hypothetical protein
MLLFVLIIIGLSQRAGFERKMVTYTQERTRAFFVSWEGLEEVMKLLKEDDMEVDSYKDKWASGDIKGKGENGDWKVVSIYDEERFININKCGEKILGRIFKNYPVLYDSLLDWLDKDNIPRPLGAEDDYYQKKWGYECRDGEMQSIHEIFLLKGADSLASYPANKENIYSQDNSIIDTSLSIFDRLLLTGIAYAPPPPDPGVWPIVPPDIPWFPNPGTWPIPGPPEEPPQGPPFDPPQPDPKGSGITIHGDGYVNINTALPQVLMALGFQPDTVRRIIWYLMNGNVFPAADANTIIKELIDKDWLRPGEPQFAALVGNIKEVAGEVKLKVDSSYFSVRIDSQTRNLTPHTIAVVMKRTKSPQGEVKFEFVRWWETSRY